MRDMSFLSDKERLKKEYENEMIEYVDGKSVYPVALSEVYET